MKNKTSRLIIRTASLRTALSHKLAVYSVAFHYPAIEVTRLYNKLVKKENDHVYSNSGHHYLLAAKMLAASPAVARVIDSTTERPRCHKKLGRACDKRGRRLN